MDRATVIGQGIAIARFAHKAAEAHCLMHGTTVAAKQGQGIILRHNGSVLSIPVAAGMHPGEIGGQIEHWMQEICPKELPEEIEVMAIDKPK